MAFWTKILKSKKEGAKEHAEKETPRAPEQKNDAPAKEEKRRESAAFPAITGILKSHHITEKTSNAAKENKYVFSIAAGTNKPMVKRAVEDRYHVGVEEVRIINLPAKKRVRGRQIGWKPGIRKAIVQVKEGQTIEIQ